MLNIKKRPGLPIAPHCTERLRAFGDSIFSQRDPPDILLLQEVWARKERLLLQAQARASGYHYFHYFHHAIGFPVPFGVDGFGTGLFVISKYPIVDSGFHHFSLTGGNAFYLHEADYVASKGVGLVRIKTPRGLVDCYLTHLVSNYTSPDEPAGVDTYLSSRSGQAYELGKFIHLTRKSPLRIVAGDFNSSPESLCVELMTTVHDLTDVTTTSEVTFGDNCFSQGEHPVRMDYILYQSTARDWTLRSSDLYKQHFQLPKDITKWPISDHWGMMAEFEFHAGIRVAPMQDETPETKSNVKRVCIAQLLDLLESGLICSTIQRQRHFQTAGVSAAGLSLVLILSLIMSLSTTVWACLSLTVLVLVAQCAFGLLNGLIFATLECRAYIDVLNQVKLHFKRLGGNPTATRIHAGPRRGKKDK